MVLISIYILGVVCAIADLAIRLYNEAERVYSFAFCITYVLFKGRTWQHTLKSWFYFIQTWGK